MRKRNVTMLALSGACILVAAFVIGCTGKNMSLREALGIRIEVLPSGDGKVEIAEAGAYRENGDLVVAGTAKMTGPLFSSYKGHIDIAVLPPGGGRAELSTSEYSHHPSRRTSSSFQVRFPVPAKKGTRVVMLFHSVNDTGSEHSNAVERLLGERG